MSLIAINDATKLCLDQSGLALRGLSTNLDCAIRQQLVRDDSAFNVLLDVQ